MFKKIYLASLFLSLFAVTQTSFAAATAPNVNSTTNDFLGAIAQTELGYAPSDNTATALLLELGMRNLRANGTVGVALTSDNSQWLKFTGEFLAQDIDYVFFSGVDREWVEQGAIGLGYQYNIANSIFRNLDFSTYYSHAPSHDLSTISGSYIQYDGAIINYTDYRRIAGSNAEGAEAGFTSHLWPGADLKLAADYDNVVYDMRYQAGQNARGFGGTVTFDQILTGRFKMHVLSSLRAAYNEYQVGFSFLTPTRAGNFEWGVFGNYTNGKHTLPDTRLVGVNVTYSSAVPRRYSDAEQDDTLQQWVAKPAVYMPEVLAVVDQRVTSTATCTAASTPQSHGSVPAFLGAVAIDALHYRVPASDIGPISAYFTPTTGLSYSIVKVRNTSANATVQIAGNGDLLVTLTSPSAITDMGSYVFHASSAVGCGADSNAFQIDIPS